MNLRTTLRFKLAMGLLASALWVANASAQETVDNTSQANPASPQLATPQLDTDPVEAAPGAAKSVANPVEASPQGEEDEPPAPPLFRLASQQQPAANAADPTPMAPMPNAPMPAANGAAGEGIVENALVDDMFNPENVIHEDYWSPNQLLPTRQLFVELDFLNWWTKGMYLPPLASTGPDADGLVLGSTTVLFGGQEYMENPRGGGRIRVGSDLGCWGCGGWEVEYFGLEQEWLGFSVGSDNNGLPFLGRPYFNMNPRDDMTGLPIAPARPDAQLVSGVRTGELLRGRVTVDVNSSFVGAAARWKCSLGGNQGMLNVQDCGDSAYATNVDFVAGYRYLRLSEGLLVREDLTQVDTVANTSRDIDIFDQFDTMNEFHGVELGVQLRTAHRDWILALAGRMALGNVEQSVHIDGQTNNGGVLGVGGLLAQSSNIGLYKRNVFSVVPELEARLSRRLTQHISFSAGYNLVYWSRVARPGEQVDLDINPDLWPPPIDPVVGPLRPEFAFRDTDFWAHGLTLGLNIEW